MVLLTWLLRLAVVRELFNVVRHAIELPLGVDFALAPQKHKSEEGTTRHMIASNIRVQPTAVAGVTNS